MVCKPCVSKRATLSKMFGSWPLPSFTLLTKEQQTSFWACPARHRGALEVALAQEVTAYKINDWKKSKKGKYLPLSVYAKQGFNIKDIAQYCTDTKEDPVLGKTYCVNVSSKEEGEIEREARKDVTSFRVDLNKAMASQSKFETRGKNRAIEDKTANSQRKKKKSSTSSSSSSSSEGNSEAAAEEDAPAPTKKELAQQKKAEIADAKKKAKEEKEEAKRLKKLASQEAADAKKKKAKLEARARLGQMCLDKLSGPLPLLIAARVQAKEDMQGKLFKAQADAFKTHAEHIVDWAKKAILLEADEDLDCAASAVNSLAADIKKLLDKACQAKGKNTE